MNNDNDLNLHSMTKLSGWLRYWIGFCLSAAVTSNSHQKRSQPDDLVPLCKFL